MKTSYNILLIATMLIWVCVILASAAILGEAPEFPILLVILGGGAAGTLIVVSGMSRRASKASP